KTEPRPPSYIIGLTLQRFRKLSRWWQEFHSTMMRSAHSTKETKIAGLPNFAPHCVKSLSETPRARAHAPHAKIGTRFATSFSSVSPSGGQPTGRIPFARGLRSRE